MSKRTKEGTSDDDGSKETQTSLTNSDIELEVASKMGASKEDCNTTERDASKDATAAEKAPHGPLAPAINQRDVASGCRGRIRSNRLYRSSMRYDRALAVRTVFDLRRSPRKSTRQDRGDPAGATSSTKIDRSKSRNAGLPEAEHIQINLVPFSVGCRMFYNLPISTSVPALFSPRRVGILRDAVLRNVGLEKMYRMILKQKSAVRTTLRAIAAAFRRKAFPVLIHCIHGKDRTGIIVALILLLCGVSEDDVAKDYALSGPTLLRAKKNGHLSPKSPMWIEDAYIVTPEKVMHSLCAWLVRKYAPKSKIRSTSANDAVEAYVLRAGVSQTDIASLRNGLVVSAKENVPKATARRPDGGKKCARFPE